MNQTRPGHCVSCYFALHANASDRHITKLSALRNWLESNIEVAVLDENMRHLEAFPLRLFEADDLEAYCRRTMAEFHDNRAYALPRINLSFRYKQAA